VADPVKTTEKKGVIYVGNISGVCVFYKIFDLRVPVFKIHPNHYYIPEGHPIGKYISEKASVFQLPSNYFIRLLFKPVTGNFTYAFSAFAHLERSSFPAVYSSIYVGNNRTMVCRYSCIC
jgi:hypothetical protein